MVEVEVLIPTFDNSGKPFPQSDFAALEAELLTRFGAYSLPPGHVQGQWSHAGQVYADQSRVYRVAVDGLLSRADDLKAVVAFAKVTFRQIALYVRYLGQSEVL